ncbi:MAG: SPFH/Band 7/PHB domain protein [Candidatus Sumerlaeia bacterium]|nr:SPFH/Band 7/PHB domain protein [Candidatus Sumerlaeia bacterium]
MLELLESVTGVFVVVYDGQHGLKFQLGRAKSVLGPGIHLKLPIIQAVRVRETKHTTIDLEPQVIQLSDDLVYEVGAKVVYQIVDLRKALIEVDDLVEGLRNRLVITVQRIVKTQNRETISDINAMIRQVRDQLREVEDQWGIVIHDFGFSTFSPTPETLEITQLQMLASEKLRLYNEMREHGLSDAAAVSLVSGAVVTLPPSSKERKEEERLQSMEIAAEQAERILRQKGKEPPPGMGPGEAGEVGP